MTDPHDTTRPQGEQDSRSATLIRRAGEVESAPGPLVWDRIRADLDTDTETQPERDTGTDVPVGDLASRQQRRRGAGASTPPGRRRAWPLVAAAAAGALLTWAGSALIDDPGAEDGDLVASGALESLPDTGSQVQGEAQVVVVDGQSRLRVELDQLPDAGDGYLEVWLLRPDVSGLVTLGVLTGEDGEFDLPIGVDLADYPVVDISREQVDGDPTHGGDSLVRGQLEGTSAGSHRTDDLD